MTSSIRTTFDHELTVLRQDILKMSEMVSEAIKRSILSLKEKDHSLAASVIAEDIHINELRFRIEEACLTTIATQQPIASDLREIVAIMHGVLELERMGDHAAGIAKTVINMENGPPIKPLKKISRMAEISREMLDDCMQAFLEKDAIRAREIASQDANMDRLYRAVFERLINIMSKHPRLVTRATYLMWCAHNLERIADRVTNLAEQVVFMTTGDLGELDS